MAAKEFEQRLRALLAGEIEIKAMPEIPARPLKITSRVCWSSASSDRVNSRPPGAWLLTRIGQ